MSKQGPWLKSKLWLPNYPGRGPEPRGNWREETMWDRVFSHYDRYLREPPVTHEQEDISPDPFSPPKKVLRWLHDNLDITTIPMGPVVIRQLRPIIINETVRALGQWKNRRKWDEMVDLALPLTLLAIHVYKEPSDKVAARFGVEVAYDEHFRAIIKNTLAGSRPTGWYWRKTGDSKGTVFYANTMMAPILSMIRHLSAGK